MRTCHCALSRVSLSCRCCTGTSVAASLDSFDLRGGCDTCDARGRDSCMRECGSMPNECLRPALTSFDRERGANVCARLASLPRCLVGGASGDMDADTDERLGKQKITLYRYGSKQLCGNPCKYQRTAISESTPAKQHCRPHERPSTKT